jgi:iron complex transport system permease protein
MSGRAILLCVACAAVVVLAPLAGAMDPAHRDFVLWQLRVPRALMAACVGATLGVVGAAFQTVLQNSLATPSTVGTTAGATLGALAFMSPGLPLPDLGLPGVALAAFAGALLVTLFLTALAGSRRLSVNDVLLGGIAITLAASALSTMLRALADMSALFSAVQWSLGHLPQVGFRGAVLLLPFVAPAVAVLLTQRRGLEALVGGDERAHSQGVDVRRVRSLVLGTGALAVAACVAWCGPIAFVGLIVPHLVRLAIGPNPRVVLPFSLVAGAGFLVASDTAARLLLPGRELPVGVLTAAMGAPALLWLLVRRRRPAETIA